MDRSPRAPAPGATTAADAPVALVEGVDKAYRRGRARVQALADVSLAVRAGELLALVGPSGCGKSTLLNLLAAVDRPDAGRVRVCGVELAQADERALTLLRRRSIGVVFQAFHLLASLTAAENVALPLALDGRSDPARVLALLARVGLAQRADHHPAALSGGEEQRVAIARALVHGPALLLADEPTGNLDSASGAEVLALLDALRREAGLALVIATHDPEVAARADRVVALRDGRVVASEARA